MFVPSVLKARRLLVTSSLQGRLTVTALVVLLLYPWFSTQYAVDLLSAALIFGIFAISLDLLWGYAGMLNLGPAFSFGLGAYTWAIVSKRFDLFPPTYPALALAMLLPALLALIVSYVAFRARTSDIYFALIALAVSLTLEKIAQVWYDFTGGANGIINIPRLDLGAPGVLSLSLDEPMKFYYFVLAATALVLAFGSRLVNSPFGRVLQAIRENEVRVETLGYSTLRYKVIISVISAAIGGFAGALYAPLAGIVYPGLFGVLLSVQVFVWVAVGGQGTLVGPLIGAVLIKLIESSLSGALVSVYLIAVGIIFVAVVLFFPGGLMGIFASRPRSVEERTATSSPVAPAATTRTSEEIVGDR